MPFVLEGPHPLERDRAADVDVRRGDVDPELHAQRPPERELALELALRQHVDGVPRQLAQAHGASLDARPAPLKSPRSAPSQEVPRGERQAPSPDPQASPPHPPRPGGSVLLRLVRVRVRRRDPRRHPPARPGSAGEAPPEGRDHLRLDRPPRARAARRLREPQDHPLGRDRAGDEAGDRRDRGQAVLRAPRRRRARHRARRLAGRARTRRWCRAARRSPSSSSRTRT